MTETDDCYFVEEAKEMETLFISTCERIRFRELYDKFIKDVKKLKSYSRGVKEKLESLDNEELSEILETPIDILAFKNVNVEFQKDFKTSETFLNFEVFFKDGKNAQFFLEASHSYGEDEHFIKYKNENYCSSNEKFKKVPRKIRAFFNYVIEEIFSEIVNDNEELV